MTELIGALLAQVSWPVELPAVDAVADAVLAFCSFALAISLVYLRTRHVERAFWPLVNMFFGVLMASGTAYSISLATDWYPLDGLEAIVKSTMALLMIGTAVIIVRSLPAISALASRSKLERLNANLGVVNAQLSVAVADAEDARKQLAIAAEQLHAQSVTDALTEVHNRRGFDARLAEALADARRSAGVVSLLMIDIDNFKQYNDEFGHPKGDECLRIIAEAIRSSVRRPRDFVARFGGEEFVVIMEGTDPLGASFLAECVRAAVVALDLKQGSGSRLGFVTVSIGVATAQRPDDLVPALLLSRADRAMYAVKAAGGNGIIVANEAVTVN